jgi:SAM-dependent methyltransferase
MPIYHDYAPFYDGSGQIRFAVLIGQYLRELLVRHPVSGRRALDLACGTGTLALILADDGWQVTGLDRSAAMLAIARERAADAGSAIAFIEGDMRELRMQNEELRNNNAISNHSSFFILHSAFDLVTCTYDSLNYLLAEPDLASCFAGVAAALRPGGLFFVDMNTRHFLEHDWGVCDVLERPGFVQVAQSHFESTNACSTMVLTGFAGDDEHGYQRFDETHIERAYAPEIVAGLLEAAGLQIEASYDCFTFQPAHDRTQRIAWVVRKPDPMT